MRVGCEEATTLCTKSQYEKLRVVEQLKLNFHLFMCKDCSAFSKQNKTLSKCIKEHLKHSPNEFSQLSVKEKEVMLEKLKEKYVQEMEESRI